MFGREKKKRKTIKILTNCVSYLLHLETERQAEGEGQGSRAGGGGATKEEYQKNQRGRIEGKAGKVHHAEQQQKEQVKQMTSFERGHRPTTSMPQ